MKLATLTAVLVLSIATCETRPESSVRARPPLEAEISPTAHLEARCETLAAVTTSNMPCPDLLFRMVVVGRPPMEYRWHIEEVDGGRARPLQTPITTPWAPGPSINLPPLQRGHYYMEARSRNAYGESIASVSLEALGNNVCRASWRLDTIFRDGFERGTAGAWSGLVPQAPKP